MPAANIIQLRQLLADKFPGLRTHLEETPPESTTHWVTGLPRLDTAFQGGLGKGTLVEIVGAEKSSGSASVLRAILGQAAREKRIIALIDAADSLDVTGIEAGVLSRLLWVRCRSTEEAMKAADLLLRDGNVSLVLIDLVLSPAQQLRKVSSTTWYRFQRLVEETATICVVFTPRTLVTPAQNRVILHSMFSLHALEEDIWQEQLAVEIPDTQQLPAVTRSFS